MELPLIFLTNIERGSRARKTIPRRLQAKECNTKGFFFPFLSRRRGIKRRALMARITRQRQINSSKQDLRWCSNVLHFLSPTICISAAEKLANSAYLKPTQLQMNTLRFFSRSKLLAQLIFCFEKFVAKVRLFRC